MNTQKLQNKGVLVAVVAVAMAVGVVGGNALRITSANAQATTGTPAAQNTAPPAKQDFDPAKGGHVGANGKREEILTGSNADKAKAAALKAVPGGTVDRVETDADGAVYEAHMTKSDGTRVTVLFDANFNVTSTEEGFGHMKSR